MKKPFLFFFILIALQIFQTVTACTTAILSGKCTTDGRPLMWKLRDADDLENAVKFFNDGKFTYIGLINAKDLQGENVWGGANSQGFSIMNNASFNVNLEDTTAVKKDQEGRFMKLALQTCATLQDFEKLLESYPKPRGLAANFGVIDAHGGAAYYEVNNHTYTKYDANDVNTAPNGYLVRTNFSFNGKKDVGYGFIRYQTAEEIFGKAYRAHKLNYQAIIQEFTRCFYHPVLNVNYREKYKNVPYGKNFITSDDLITRHGSVSSIVVQGVKAGEPADLSTIWMQVGFPETSVAVPLWVRGGENLPWTLSYNAGMKNSPLNKAALEWKNKCYPIGRSDGYHYLNISELINTEGTGFVQRIETLEKEIFAQTDKRMAGWRKFPPSVKEIQDYYSVLDQKTIDFYSIKK